MGGGNTSMTQIRTDLALEAAENLQAGGPAAGELSGVVTRTERRQGVSVTEVRILDETGARALGKPVGRYVTMELESQPFSQQAACLASLLAELLPRGPVLTAGIGNRDMTCDAIGPTAVDHLLVTRHLVRSGQEPFRGMGELSALCTEVLGRTGMETCELIRAAAGAVRPAAVVAVDALAARSEFFRPWLQFFKESGKPIYHVFFKTSVEGGKCCSQKPVSVQMSVERETIESGAKAFIP